MLMKRIFFFKFKLYIFIEICTFNLYDNVFMCILKGKKIIIDLASKCGWRKKNIITMWSFMTTFCPLTQTLRMD